MWVWKSSISIKNWYILNISTLKHFNRLSPPHKPCRRSNKRLTIFVQAFFLTITYIQLFWSMKIIQKMLNKFETPSSKDALCKVWLSWSSGSGEKDFKFRQCQLLFCYFVFISLWKNKISFIRRHFVLNLVQIG